MRKFGVAVLGLFLLALVVEVPGLSQGKTCADCLAVLNDEEEERFDAIPGVGDAFKGVLARTLFVVSPCTREGIIAAVGSVRSDKGSKRLGEATAEIIVWKLCPWLFCEKCGVPASCPPPPPCLLCTVESLFVSPSVDGAIEARLIAILDAATQTVDLAMFSFTDDQLGAAVIRAHQRGVAVRVIRDGAQSANSGDENDRLREAGIEVVVENMSGPLLHHKFLVVDKAITVTGSYNWSDAADQSNFENVVVIVCPEVAASFTAEFNRIWSALKAGQTP